MGEKRQRKSRRRDLLRRGDHHRHQLYEWAVQAPDFEVALLTSVFRRLRGREPRRLREDFCGTALLCARWIEQTPRGEAIGLDLHGPTLRWGRRRHLTPLGAKAGRVSLLQQDVRTVTRPRADIACAFNFSYYAFGTAAELIDYFRQVRLSLHRDGLFFLDCYGGWESQQVLTERREIDGPAGRFVYVWDQAAYNPVDNTTRCHIHFEFAGGETMARAFTYRWRLYTPAEVRDALLAAGFDEVRIYWDRSPEEDESDYRPARRAENTPGWLAYVVGLV